MPLYGRVLEWETFLLCSSTAAIEYGRNIYLQAVITKNLASDFYKLSYTSMIYLPTCRFLLLESKPKIKILPGFSSNLLGNLHKYSKLLQQEVGKFPDILLLLLFQSIVQNSTL
jgi:hypothetical protein